MKLNDVMRLQNYLIDAADERIKNGGSIGHKRPAMTPMGALYVQKLNITPEQINREQCVSDRYSLSGILGLSIGALDLASFWRGFDGKEFDPDLDGEGVNRYQFECLYEVGQFLRKKYDDTHIGAIKLDILVDGPDVKVRVDDTNETTHINGRGV